MVEIIATAASKSKHKDHGRISIIHWFSIAITIFVLKTRVVRKC